MDLQPPSRGVSSSCSRCASARLAIPRRASKGRGALKTLRLFCIGLLLVLCQGPSVGAGTAEAEPGAAKYSPFYGSSWAVVIGIDAYEKVPHLNSAVADARAVADLLPSLGFSKDKTFLLLDAQATKAKIESTLYRDLRRMGPDDRLFVYFAGHGETMPIRTGEEGYILPVDADPDALAITALAMNDIRRVAERLPGKHYLFVMDACFSGFAVTRAAAGRALSADFFAAALRESVVEVITAGRKGQESIEDSGHGLFTRRLLDGLRGSADPEGQGFVSAAQLATWITPKVAGDSKGRMTPQYSRLDGEGQFLFIMPGASLHAPADNLSGTFTGMIQGTANGEPYTMPVTVTFVQGGRSLSGTWMTSVGSSGTMEGLVDGLQLRTFKVDQQNPCPATFHGAAAAEANRNVVSGSYDGTDCASKKRIASSFRLVRVSKEEPFDPLDPEDLKNVGYSYFAQGRYDDAADYLDRAARASKRAGNEKTYAVSLLFLGLARAHQGDDSAAVRLLNESIQLQQSLGDEAMQAIAFGVLGLTHMEKGRLEDATKAFEESLRLATKLNDRPNQARALYNLGRVAQRNANTADAVKFFERAMTLSDELTLAEKEQIRQAFEQARTAGPK